MQRPSSQLPTMLCSLDPDVDALRRHISAAIDEADLQEIANADYGWRYEEQYAALRGILLTGTVPPLLTWVPREVCELVRNVPPRLGPDTPPVGDTRLRQAEARRCAFCCTILLRRLADGAEGHVTATGMTVSSLISCVLVLGDPFITLARRTLAGVACSENVLDCERPTIALGALLCWLSEAEGAIPGDLIERIGHRIADGGITVSCG